VDQNLAEQGGKEEPTGEKTETRCENTMNRSVDAGAIGEKGVRESATALKTLANVQKYRPIGPAPTLGGESGE